MSESHFQFLSPRYFVLFAVLPFLLWFEWRKLRALKLPIPSVGLLSAVKRTGRARLEMLHPLLRIAGLALLIIALARPQVVTENTEIHSEGVDIVLVLDTSLSMKALDMTLNGERSDRMSVVKSVVKEFVQGRQHDRIGMVVFGQEAYTQCPLTLDYDVLVNYLDLIEVGIAGDATAIGNALATAVKRLDGSEAESRVVILLTDGANTAGEISPEIAAEVAKEQGVKVYTIAVGSRSEVVPFPVDTPFGTRIENKILTLDEELLKKIAATADGKFFRADSTESLRRIYATIDALEKSEVTIDQFSEAEEQYLTWLIPAIALLGTGWILRHTYFLRVP